MCNINKITFWRFLTQKKKKKRLEIQNAFVIYLFIYFFLGGNVLSLYEYVGSQSNIPDKVFQ